jgi:hypothetical protein
MRLIAITGMRHDAKLRLAHLLIERLIAQTSSLIVLDNGDEPLRLDALTSRRLAGGCVCCSLAEAVIPLVWRMQTDYGLLLVSSAADSHTLALILDSLQGTPIEIITVALIDDSIRSRFPYTPQKLAFYATYAFYKPFDFVELADAILRV